MQRTRPARTLGSVLAFAVFLAGGVAPAASHAAPSVRAPRHRLGPGTSTNWSGYTVDGTNATHAIGTWTQPIAACAPGENSWSSPWVGIDGNVSNTVEQTGTDSDCQGGTPTYYAWYEMYPKGVVTVPLTIRANDSITAEVTYASGAFALKLTDNSTGHSYSSPRQFRSNARRTSVEWIMEGPSNGLLSNFGTVGFTGAAGAISGQSGALSSLSGASPITMVTSTGLPRAVPSSPPSGGSFSVNWQHS